MTSPATEASAGTPSSATREPLDAELEAERAVATTLAGRVPAGVAATVALAMVVAGATSYGRTHAAVAGCAVGWTLVLGVLRVWSVRGKPPAEKAGLARHRLAFRAGALAAATSWGLSSAALVYTLGFGVDSLLMLLTCAGVSAGALSALAPDKALLRAYLGAALVPTLLACLFAPGPAAYSVGVAVVTGFFLVFLLLEGARAHREIVASAAKTALLEARAAELETARRQALEGSRAKSEFLANMSHEIRTPMTAVMGYADLLVDPGLEAHERQAYTHTIRRSAKSLLNLLDGILDLSKIEAGKMTVESVACSPAALLADVASLMRVAAQEKGVHFDVLLEGAIPETVRSDPARIRQILLNLVGNAIKFTAKGSVLVRVRCEAKPGEAPALCFAVQDTGIGIEAQAVNRLFSAFSQADGSVTRKYGGTGLGLAISKEIASLLGGDVTVTSQPGSGSTFTLRLETGPLDGVGLVHDLAEALVKKETLGDITLDGAAKRLLGTVLLAEDSPENQRLISAFLRKSGAEVTVAKNGREAVDQALGALSAGHPYDVVLMDMQMPLLDGCGATAELRASGYTLPIIALTANAMAAERAQCMAAGCDEFLTKPIKRLELLVTVGKFMEKARSQPPTPARRPSATPLLSEMAEAEEFRELLVSFLVNLKRHAGDLEEACARGDRATLARVSHQLRGSGGSYGFPLISEAAKRLEAAVKENEQSDLRSDVGTLASLCRRAAIRDAA